MMQIRRSTVQTYSGLEKKKEHLNLREGLGELCQHLSHCRQPDQEIMENPTSLAAIL